MKIDNNNFMSNDFIDSFAKKEVESKSNIFEDALSAVSSQENAVTEMKTQYVNGEREDIDNILLEGQKLNLQLNFILQVRNNMVDMYKQLSTMQI